MTWPKSQSKTAKDYPNKKTTEFRIIDGKPTKVYVQGIHVLGPVEDNKPQVPASVPQLKGQPKPEKKEEIPTSLETPSPLETPVPAPMPTPTGEKAGTGLQLIPEEEVAGTGGIEGPKIEISETSKDEVDCPHCKSKNVNMLLDLEKVRRYRCKDCDETFVKDKPIETENKVEIPNIAITQAKEITKEEITTPITTQKAEEVTKGEIVAPKAEEVTKSETVTPKPRISTPAYTKAGVDIQKQETITNIPPKIEIKIPKTEIKMPNIPTPKIEIKIPKTEIKIPNIDIPKKADEVKPQVKTEAKPQQIEKKKPTKEVKYMADEETSYQQPQQNVVKQLEELLNKKKISRQEFDEIMAEKKFNESIVQAAKFAEETREQIPQISEKIEGVSTEIKDIEGRLSTVNNSVDVLCTGVDCIKTDVKKSQETQEALEKQMEQRFRDLEVKVQELKQPTFVCDSCGDDRIRPLDSYCPNCGSPIHEWNDDTGQPVKGWAPYWKRMGRQEP